MDTKVKELITASMDKIHEMADANTIMGTPVQVDGGVTIIPVSKVSYGFAGGGSDLPSKTDKELFGGASGAGVTVTPLGFLVISNGEVQLMQMNLDVSTSSAIVNMVPEVFNKVANLFKKDKPAAADKRAVSGSVASDAGAAGDTDDIELPEEMVADDNMTDGINFDFEDWYYFSLHKIVCKDCFWGNVYEKVMLPYSCGSVCFHAFRRMLCCGK